VQQRPHNYHYCNCYNLFYNQCPFASSTSRCTAATAAAAAATAEAGTLFSSLLLFYFCTQDFVLLFHIFGLLQEVSCLNQLPPCQCRLHHLGQMQLKHYFSALDVKGGYKRLICTSVFTCNVSR